MADEIYCKSELNEGMLVQGNILSSRYTYKRNGKPKPSFAPASDEIISRKSRRTYLSEKGPLATAWERIGSVHVTHEPMTRAASYNQADIPKVRNVLDSRQSRQMSLTRERLGIVMRMHTVVNSHIRVMTGKRQIAISTQRSIWYLAGS